MPYILKAGQVESKDNKIEIISKESTHDQYPSAKAVYDALSGINEEDLKDLDNRVDTAEKDINTNKNNISSITKQIVSNNTTINRLNSITSNLEEGLEKVPIKYVESPDANGNILHFRELPSGVYVLSGTFKPYATSDETIDFGKGTQNRYLTTVHRGYVGELHHTYLQMFNPIGSALRQYHVVYNSNTAAITYSSKTINLNDLTTKKKVEEMIDEAISETENNSVLIVEWDVMKGRYATHGPQQIFAHTQNGGIVVLHIIERTGEHSYLPLMRSTETVAFFIWYSPTNHSISQVYINADKDASVQIDNLLSYDESIIVSQNWTDGQKKIARDNIDAASIEDLNNKANKPIVLYWDGVQTSLDSVIDSRDDSPIVINDIILAAHLGTTVLLCEDEAHFYTLDHATPGVVYFKSTETDSTQYLVTLNAGHRDIQKQQLSSSGGGSNIVVDDTFSSTSTNPVQNKVINAKFAKTVQVTSQVLTDDQKSIARQNIGAMSEEDVDNKIASLSGGGPGLLVVNLVDNTVDCPYEDIISHILSGGNVVLCEEDNTYYSLDHMRDGILWFKGTWGDYYEYLVAINPDGTVEFIELSLTGNTTFAGEVARLDGRIDLINTSGGSGIVIDADLDSNSTNPVQNKVVTDAIGTIGNIATMVRDQATYGIIPRLEKLEAPIIVNITVQGTTLSSDKTSQEIYEYVMSGRQVFAELDNSDMLIPLDNCYAEQATFASHPSNDTLGLSFICVRTNDSGLTEVTLTNSTLVSEDAIDSLRTTIGDIQSVLDAIISIQENIIGKITFTIGTVSYEAINGMTWGEWVNSRYNSGLFTYSSENYIIGSENKFVVDSELGEKVILDSIIKDGHTYEEGADYLNLIGTIVNGVMIGDANGDGEVDGKDIAMLQQYVASPDMEGIDKVAGDIDGSGDINTIDLALLQQQILETV